MDPKKTENVVSVISALNIAVSIVAMMLAAILTAYVWATLGAGQAIGVFLIMLLSACSTAFFVRSFKE